MIAFAYIFAALIFLAGLVLLVRAFLAPDHKLERGAVAVIVMLVAVMLLALWLMLANFNWTNMGPGTMFPFWNPATVQNETVPSASEVDPFEPGPTVEDPEVVLEGQSAEYYFVPTSTLPECFPVNGPWLEAFGNGLLYEIDPADPIFDQTAFNYFEGVIIPSTPSDLHITFEMIVKFVAEQGNVWTCDVVTDPKIMHTILFQSADKKWQNWDGQPTKPFHDETIITPFGGWSYDAGIQPAWALEEDDTNLVCPFTTVSMSNPAGVIQSDGSFVGAPGKAGCDFVAIYPDGQAVRYHDAIDSFPYPADTRFFLFEKSKSNEEVAKAINVATVTDAK